MKILSTTKYDQFKDIKGNRSIRKEHVKKVAESIKQYNLLPYQPILVTKDLYIIDGQHRLAAAKSLKIPIPYIIVPHANLSTIQMLNSALKGWSLVDFCLSYIDLGKEDYERLLAFAKHYGINVTVAASLLQGTQVHSGGGNAMRILRTGTFTITKEQEAEEIMERIAQIKPFTEANAWAKREFISALLYLYSKGMKHEKLIEQLRSSGKRIYREQTKKDFMFRLMDIYNRGMKKDLLQVLEKKM